MQRHLLQPRLAAQRQGLSPSNARLQPTRGALRVVSSLNSGSSAGSESAGDNRLPLSAGLSWVQRQAWLPFLPQSREVSKHTPAAGGGSGGASGGSGGDGGGGGGGDDGSDSGADDGSADDKILSYTDVERVMHDNKVTLPADMLEVAKKHGLRASVVLKYLAMKDIFLTGLLVRHVPFFRDRILADPLFFFKVFAEVAIDSACTTIAEVRKRGDDFWGEFELYMSDLMVGLTLDVVLVSLMAPVAVLGGASKVAMATGIQKVLANIPSAVFEASVPGVKSYSTAARLGCLVVKFCEYSLAGMFCGLVGQGIANYAIESHRKTHGAADNAPPPPPLVKTALVWGLFMGVSSNLRYQTVFGIERLVDMTIAKKVPQVAYATTVIIRFLNNVIGGENFIDMARWAGVQ